MTIFESEIAPDRNRSFQVRADVWINHTGLLETAGDGNIIVFWVRVTGQGCART